MISRRLIVARLTDPIGVRLVSKERRDYTVLSNDGPFLSRPAGGMVVDGVWNGVCMRVDRRGLGTGLGGVVGGDAGGGLRGCFGLVAFVGVFLL